MTKNRNISKNLKLDDIRKDINRLQIKYDPELVLKKAKTELEIIEEGSPIKGDLFKAMTLNESQNGMFISIIVPEIYSTFAIDMLRKIQIEFSCKLVSEMATAEILVLTYIRILELQRKIDMFLEMDRLKPIDINYFSLLSKELDRANRQYLTTIQLLTHLKSPSLKVNINTKTAIVGQEQYFQINKNDKPL